MEDSEEPVEESGTSGLADGAQLFATAAYVSFDNRDISSEPTTSRLIFPESTSDD